MEHWKRLGLPLMLGVAAAMINWYTVSQKVQPRTFVAVRKHVEEGETIEKGMLARIEICGDTGLDRTALPWSQAAILLGQRASRTLKRGDLVLRRDIISERYPIDVRDGERAVPVSMKDVYVPNHVYVGDYVTFLVTNESTSRYEGNSTPFAPANQELGPFRIVAVGDQVVRLTDEEKKRRVNELTLAVMANTEQDSQTAELVQAIRTNRVLSIVLLGEEPSNEIQDADQEAEETESDELTFASTEGETTSL